MGLIKMFLYLFVEAATVMVLAYCVLSWFLPRDSKVFSFVASIVEPMLAPIRRIMPVGGMMDFSPVILMVILQLIQRLIGGI